MTGATNLEVMNAVYSAVKRVLCDHDEELRHQRMCARLADVAIEGLQRDLANAREEASELRKELVLLRSRLEAAERTKLEVQIRAEAGS